MNRENVQESILKIPVVLAADENYAWPMSVTIISILENAKADVFYDIYILVPGEFSDDSKELMKLLDKYYSRCTITFINMENAFGDAAITIKHISKVTYYRLKIPELLSQYDKCIYIDVDTAVTKDLTEFYEINMENYYMAGVKAFIYEPKRAYHSKRLGIDNIDNYVNAGVVLFNLEEIRKNGIDQQFIELAKQVFESQDQDIVNIACFNHVKLVPLKYNLMTKYIKLKDEELHIEDTMKEYVVAKELEEAIDNPIVIHYADKIKPWTNDKIPYAEIWWKYAKYSPFTYVHRAVEKEVRYSNRRNNKVQELEGKIRYLRRELNAVRGSRSYRIGMKITFLPRKVRGGIKCMQENGFKYTIRLIKNKYK